MKECYLELNDFVKKYNVTRGVSYQHKLYHGIKNNAFKGSYPLYINENHFLKRKQFIKRVQLECQEYYYYFLEFYNHSTLGRVISKIFPNVTSKSMSAFFCVDLFVMSVETSIFNFKMGTRLWNFYRWARWTVITLLKLKGIKEKPINYVGKVLDRRM